MAALIATPEAAASQGRLQDIDLAGRLKVSQLLQRPPSVQRVVQCHLSGP
jgi:hypothetical protein